MSIKIYYDDNAIAVFVEDANGVQFLNTLQASVSDTDINNVTISDLPKQIGIVSETNYTEFIDENDNPYGDNSIDVCNALNVVFTNSGTSLTNLPEITSPLVINSVVGNNINYELTANYGVGYEWNFTNVPSITTVNGNDRKIIGGSSLAIGTYNIPVKAINYNGEDSETLVLNVENPAFENTKSVKFNQFQYLNSIPISLITVLGRLGNGSGSSDAWTINKYFKPGFNTAGSRQTIFFYGGSDYDNSGHIWIYYKGNEQALYFEYGSRFNYIRLKSPDDSLQVSTWSNICITYDGGTTGSSSGSTSDYYSRFKMFIDGIEITTIDSNNNFGWNGAINSEVFYIGRRTPYNDFLRNNCRIDEISIFDSDQSANISDIYNGGVPFDLTILSTPPTSWWRMGDGDTYPILQDSIGFSDMEMFSMNPSNIVNDVPV